MTSIGISALNLHSAFYSFWTIIDRLTSTSPSFSHILLALSEPYLNERRAVTNPPAPEMKNNDPL